MTKIENRKQVIRLACMFAFAYMVSYITRINFGAIISEICASSGYPEVTLSLALTGSFITYGIGQVVSGFLGDRFSPKYLLSFGFCLTALMNFLVPLCNQPYLMVSLWCINGFAQSFMWPPLVATMSFLFSASDYKRVVNLVSWGGSLGTMTVYLVAPLIISLSGWKYVFFFCGGCAVVMLVVWHRFAPFVPAIRRHSDKKEPSGSSPKSPLFSTVMIFIMIAIIIMGMLRDGVTTWMPSYIAETYHLSTVSAILSGVIMPIFSIVCIQCATTLYMKRFSNPVSCGLLFFCLGMLCSVGVVMFSGRNPILSIFFTALLIGSMHGANLMLVCMIPAYFEKYGNVSTASGVINACTYVGSALFTYGIAFLSEENGWGFILKLWILFAALGSLICACSVRPFRKKFFHT